MHVGGKCQLFDFELRFQLQKDNASGMSMTRTR